MIFRKTTEADIDRLREGLMEITFAIDVLMSFRRDILLLGVIVDKQSMIDNGDEYIDDGSDPESTPEDVANGKEYVVGSEAMKPLAFAYMIGNNDAVEMLKRHGAAETDDITAFVREQENEKKARWHKLFLQAIDKLCGTDDSPENHKLIRNCLKHGESVSEEIRGVRLAVETPDSPPCYVRAPLYGVAILHGWTNMLQDCLEIGFPANDEITFVLDVDYGGGVDVDVESKGFVENVCEGDVVASWTPMQIAQRCNKAKKRDVVELLKKYGAK